LVKANGASSWTLAERLFTPDLTLESRLEIAVRMQGLLNVHQAAQVNWIPPPVMVNAEVA
jgi:hypothetical protein